MANQLQTCLFDPAGLRFRISLLKPHANADQPWLAGQQYDTHAEIWAGIIRIGAGEHNEAEQNANIGEIQFIIRHRSDLNGVTHLLHQGETYDLLSSYDPDQMRRWSILQTRKSLGHA